MRRTDDDALSLDHQLCFALYAASRAMIRAYQPLLEPLGITYPQYLALLVLWEHDGISVKQLGARLALDSGTLTPLLQRLDALGIVQRARSTTDERVVEVRLTAEGRALRARAKHIPAKLACRAGFDPSEPESLRSLGQLREKLHALVATLEASEPSDEADAPARTPPRATRATPRRAR
jgi:DNA-binding MarR family transcriptional regulator